MSIVDGIKNSFQIGGVSMIRENYRNIEQS